MQRKIVSRACARFGRLAALAVAGIALSQAVQPVPALADTGGYGTLEMHGSSWMCSTPTPSSCHDGHGVDVYSNGQNPAYASGNYTAPAIGMKWQCVELAQRTWALHGWDGSFHLWGVNANGIYGSARSGKLATYATVTPQGSIRPNSLHPGDLITYSGTFGHVVVVDSITENSDNTYTVRVVGQNQGTASPVTNLVLANGSLPAHILGTTSLTVQGVVHAKADPYYMGVAFQHPGNQVAMTGTSSGYTLYGDGTVKTLCRYRRTAGALARLGHRA